MIKRKHIFELFVGNYLKNKASRKEEQLLNHFMYLEYKNMKRNNASIEEKKKLSNSIHKAINEHIFSKPKPIYLYTKYGIAATVALLVSLGVYLKSDTKLTNRNLVASTFEKIDSLLLEDGSIIYLSANTTLEYPKNFDDTLREVSLKKGNAFFKVAKNPNKPFVVYSKEVLTKVLGTSFNINIKDTICTIMVVTGKVNVSSKKENIDLRPNQQATFDSKNNSLTKTTGLSTTAPWYKENITLEKASLKKILELLSYKFNVDFKTINIDTEKEKLTIYLEKQATLQQTLDQINYISNIKFKANESNIIVSRK